MSDHETSERVVDPAGIAAVGVPDPGEPSQWTRRVGQQLRCLVESMREFRAGNPLQIQASQSIVPPLVVLQVVAEGTLFIRALFVVGRRELVEEPLEREFGYLRIFQYHAQYEQPHMLVESVVAPFEMGGFGQPGHMVVERAQQPLLFPHHRETVT